MHLINLCISVVVLIVCYFLNTQVLSVKIDCVPVKNCPFAINILSKRYKQASPEVWNLFKMSKCGHDEKTNRIKIWCTKFTNCRTPDDQYGTCIPAKSCTALADLLKINVTAEVNIKLQLNKHICRLHQEPAVHVCCPWPAKSSLVEMTNRYSMENQKKIRQKRRPADTPWFGQSNGNYYFNPLQSQKNVHNSTFGLQAPGLSNDWFQPAGNIFTQQNTNFLDKFKSSQTDSISGFQQSFKKQNKWLQNALQNATKGIFEANQNNNNQVLNWWNWLPGRNVHNHYNLTEETSDSMQEICMTPDNFEGICRPFRQCPSFTAAVSKVNTTDSVQVEFLKQFRCTSTESNNLTVCCSEHAIHFTGSVDSTPSSEPKTTERTSNSLDHLSSICGRQIINDKIVGGTTTELTEFPWTALLQYASSKGSTFGCGGSIISNRYIVTAAHCVNVNILRQAGFQNLQQVILGEHDRRNQTDCIYTPYGSDCADPPQSFGIERILEHELFQSNATAHDIALVRLDRDIVFSDYIRPICLPTIGSLNLKDNETLTITGWGRTESGESSQVKRKANLPFVSKNNCGQLGPLTDGQICLGSGKGTDSCKGDSGSPVMMHTVRSSSDLVSVLVGIISFGFGRCGTTNSVSTYVPHYIEWILKNIS